MSFHMQKKNGQAYNVTKSLIKEFFFFLGGGGEAIWIIVHTYEKILPTPLSGCIIMIVSES